MHSKFLKNLLMGFFFLSYVPGIAQQINSEKLLQHLQFLSSDGLQGRETLSEGNLKAQTYILQHLTGLDLVEPIYPDFTQRFSYQNPRQGTLVEDAMNIIAFIPGSESRKVIVITAHYDHVGIGRANSTGDTIYNGADDNASGTAALLVLAEYFSKNRPKHALMFAALDAEEKGLRGARALVEDFPYPLDQIVLNVNMDMISRSDKNELYASGTYHNPHLKPILERASAGSNPILVFGHDLPGTGREDWTKSSDHGAFFDKKVPHVYFGVEDHPDYHKPSDEFENIHPEFYSKAVNLILKSILAFDQELLSESKTNR